MGDVTTIIGVGIFLVLVIIALLLLSIAKGMADILDQNKEFFLKRTEDINELVTIFSKFDDREIEIEEIEEEDDDKNEMYESALLELDKLNEEKSKISNVQKLRI